MYRYIAIEGNIGAGKTTLATLMAKHFDASLVLEKYRSNPFLAKFYKHPQKFALPLELSFLTERFHQLLLIEQQLKTKPSKKVISDFSWIKPLVFADSTLVGKELEIFHTLYIHLYKNVVKPDLIVYLDVDTNKLISNISKRGRHYETGIKSGYLQALGEQYYKRFAENCEIPYLIIEANTVDFVNNSNQLEQLLNAVQLNFPKGLNRFQIG